MLSHYQVTFWAVVINVHIKTGKDCCNFFSANFGKKLTTFYCIIRSHWHSLTPLQEQLLSESPGVDPMELHQAALKGGIEQGKDDEAKVQST